MRPFPSTLALCGFFALAALAPVGAAAQTQVGPYLAYHDDMDLGIGGFFKVGVPSLAPDLSFGVDVGAFFPDDSPNVDFEYFEINLDAFYDIPVQDAAVTPFVMGGLRIGRISVDNDLIGDDYSDTDLAVNMGGGVEFGSGNVRPVAGLKIELGDGSAFVLFGRLAFGTGG